MIGEIKQALQDMYGAQTDEDLMKTYKHIDENNAVWLQWSVSEIERLRKALELLKRYMQNGDRNGYESETVFWARCIWEIDEALKEEKHD